MADNTSTFTLKVKTEGMAEAKNDSQTIRDNLEGAQRAASGSASSKKMASSPAARPTGAAGASAGISGVEVENYNRAKGAAGSAGGSARDFADQARGLGGLVRLYATVAANVFALTAAFGALSRAMDTTNMVKGLDQLGAASGIALGSLSKQLVQATDGAISLREAMEATTKAVSSGMKTDDVLRIGVLAKQASQALGVNMGDAISRLTRGITKLEPELLDELGIFTKLDPAIKEYAKSVNKSVSELSDFERRAAFANAVLKEGEQKFSSIKIDANPYTKLAAEVTNAAQKILELVNKVLGPVAEFFSKSPTALLVGIGALAAVLLKQAIPALGQFKQGLEETASRAQNLAVKKAEDALKARELVDKQIIASVEARADKELKAVEVAEKKIQELQKSGLDKRGAAYKLLQKDLQDITAKDLKKVSTKADELEAQGKLKQAQAYREVVTAIEAQQKAEQNLIKVKKELTAQEEKDRKSKGTVYGLTADAGIKAQEAAVRSGILSNAAYNGSLIGISGAFKLMREEIEKNNIKGFSAGLLTLKGTLAIVAGALSTVMSLLNGVFMVIGMVSAVIALLDGLFSKAGKELTDFSSAVDRTDKSVSTLADTLELAYKTNPFSVQSLTAQSNAVVEFAASLDSLIDRTKKAEKAVNASWWDKLKDRVKDLFGFGIRDTFAETIAKDLEGALSALKTSPIRIEIQKELQDLLKIKDVNNVTELEKAIRKLDPASETVKKLGLIITRVGNETKATSEKAKEFADAFKLSEDAFKNLQKQFQVKNPLTEWSDSAITSLLKLQDNLGGPIEASISNLIKLTSDIDKNPIFGSQSLAITEFKEQLQKSNQELITNEASLKSLREELEKLEAVRKSGNILKMEDTTGLVNKSRGQLEGALDTRIKDVNDAIRRAEFASNKARADASKAATDVSTKINSALSEQVGKVATGISAELAKGGNKVLENLYSRIDFMPEYAARLQDLKLQELQSEAALIKINQDLANQTRLLAGEMAVANGRIGVTRAEEAKQNAERGGSVQAESNITQAKLDLKTAEKSLSLLKQSVTDPVGALKQLNKEFGNSEVAAKSFAKAILDSARENAGFVKALRDNAQAQQIIKEIEKPLGIEGARLKDELDSLNLTKEKLQLKQQQLNIDTQSGNLGQYGAALAAQELTTQIALNQEAVKNAELNSKTVQNQIVYAGLIRTAKTQADKTDAEAFKKKADEKVVAERALVTSQKALAIAGSEVAIRQALIDARLKEIALIYDRMALEAQHANTMKGLETDIQKSKLDYTSREISYLKEKGELDEGYAANRLADIALESQKLVQQSELRSALFDRENAFREATRKQREEEAKGGEGAGEAVAIEAVKRANEVYDAKVKLINQNNVSQTRAIEITREQGIEQAKLNQELKTQANILQGFANIADTLAEAFGKTGQVLGNFAKSIGEAVDRQITFNREKEKQKQIVDEINSRDKEGLNVEDVKRREKAEEKIGELSSNNKKQELADSAKIIASTKNMFKEKTAAYKILAATEKAIHIARLVMDAKEIGSNLAKTGSSIMEAGKRMFANGQEAITAAFAAPFPVGFIAGAAMTAIIASIIGKAIGGGGSATPPKGFTAEEQQKVQGTGQYYSGGKLVDTGAGALGDPTAKSESVVKGIDVLEKYSFKNLQFSNKMLDALIAIRENTEYFAGNILKAAPGINIKPDDIKSGNWLFGKETTETLDRGIRIIGSVGDIIDKNSKIMEFTNTKTTEGNSLFNLFGLLKDGPSYQTRETEILDKDSRKLQRDLSQIFGSMGEALGAAAETLGVSTVEGVNAAFRSIDLSEQLRVSLMGKTGKEAAEALLSVISSGMDTAALTIFPSFEKFQKIGETFADTVIRVANDVQTVSLSFESLGLSLPKLTETAIKPTQAQLDRLTTAQTAYAAAVAQNNREFMVEVPDYLNGNNTWQLMKGNAETASALAAALNELNAAQTAVTSLTGSLTTRNIDLVQSYIKAAGGLDKFLEGSRFFAENFLTEAERLAPVQRAVGKELGELATKYANTTLASVKTRQEFKEQVIAAQKLGESGVELYTALIKLAPAFAEITQEANKSVAEISPEDLVAKINQTRVKALQIMAQISGKEEDARKAVVLQRQLELAELAKYPKIQREILENNLKYIHALEDELSAKEKLVKRRDLLKSTIDNIGKAIDTLANYRKSLLAGDLSTLLPIDKYQQAKTQFEELLTTINKVPVTEAEKTAQLEAVNKLPQVSDAFLQASRMIYASSGAYVSDFESVTSALDATTGVLTDRRTDAQKQLDAITDLGLPLDSIAESSATTASLIQDYLRARDVSIGFGLKAGTQATSSDTPPDIAAALNNLSTEFKNFREAMMGVDGFRAVTTALTGTGGVAQVVTTALTGTGGVAQVVTGALTGPGGVAQVVTTALTGTGGVAETVTTALTGTGGVAQTVTKALTGAGGVTQALTGTGGVTDALTGENGLAAIVRNGLTGQGGVTDALIGTGGLLEAITGTGGVVDALTGTGGVTDALTGENGLAAIVREGLTGTGGVTDALIGTGGVLEALTGDGGVVDALTGTGGVTDALTGDNGLAAVVTGALTGTGGVTDALIGTGGILEALTGEGGVTEALVGTGGVTQALTGDNGVAAIVTGALTGTGGVTDALIGSSGLLEAITGTGGVVEALTGTGGVTQALTGDNGVAAIVTGALTGTGGVTDALIGTGGVAQVVEAAVSTNIGNVVTELGNVTTGINGATAQSAQETGAIVYAVTNSGNTIADAFVDTASLSESLGAYQNRTTPTIESGSYVGGSGRNSFDFVVVSGD